MARPTGFDIDEWSYDSIFVENGQSGYYLSHMGGAVVNGIGRHGDGTLFLTTVLGELMTWNGCRFKESGWRRALAKLFHVTPNDRILVQLKVSGNLVRGVYRVTDTNRNVYLYPFSSDDLGLTWTRNALDSSDESWKILFPIVRS